MTQHATLTLTSVKALLFGAALALMPSNPAFAQSQDSDLDMEDIARTPLQDFNIDAADIPEVLAAAVADPYASDGLETCNDIVVQIAAIDRELGADFDIAEDEEGRRINRNRIAKSLVGSFIPFRGIVREVTGANARRNEGRLAVTAGMVRRGYLKGLGQSRGCDYPARPREIRGSMTSGE